MSVIDDAVLLKMAEAEILGEAKRAAVRHSTAGVSGWRPCSKLNKTFLTNTLLHTIVSNRILSRKKADKQKKTERKLLKKNIGGEGANFVFKKPIENNKNSIRKTHKKLKTNTYAVDNKQIKSTKQSKTIDKKPKGKKQINN